MPFKTHISTSFVKDIYGLLFTNMNVFNNVNRGRNISINSQLKRSFFISNNNNNKNELKLRKTEKNHGKIKKYQWKWFQWKWGTRFKGSLLGLRKILAIDSFLKMIENAFYFTLQSFFFLKIFKFLPCLFGRLEKRLDEKDKVNFTIFMTSQPG